jgi:hypothetical protein
MLPGYVSAMCWPTLEQRRLAACVVRRVEDGEFAPLLTARDVRELVAAVPAYTVEAESQWQREFEQVQAEVGALRARCGQLPEAERSACGVQASDRYLSLMAALGNKRWSIVHESLKPWARVVAGTRGCPVIGAGESLPQNWPADCD